MEYLQSTMEVDSQDDNLHKVDKLNLFAVPSDAKYRPNSTSTPYIQQRKSINDISVNENAEVDSGYGHSLVESSTSLFDTPSTWDRCEISEIQQMTVFKTPSVSTQKSTELKGRWLQFSPCPFPKELSNNVQSEFRTCQLSASSQQHGIHLDNKDSTVNQENHPDFPAFNLETDTEIPDRKRKGCLESTECSLTKKFNEVLKQFTPNVPDRLIGRQMGLDNVDIVSELSSRSTSCVDNILQNLGTKDLIRMRRVCRQWKAICDTNSKAVKKISSARRQHKAKLGAKKENLYLKSPSKRSHRNGSVERALQTLQSLPQTQQTITVPAASRHQDMHEIFREAAKSLKNDESLHKCPRCRKPAKVLPVQERGQCMNVTCTYDFCVKCLCDFHGSRSCVPLEIKRTKTSAKIGSKQSKRNLRRL